MFQKFKYFSASLSYEKKLGRKLSFYEIAHHIDGHKLNNSSDNLRLFASQYEHNKHHRNNLERNGFWHEVVPQYATSRNYQY